MSEWYFYLIVFAIGGVICLFGQILVIKTKMTTARILVLFEMIGIFLAAFNIFDPISQFCGAGVNVPIIGFGTRSIPSWRMWLRFASIRRLSRL